MARDDFSPSVIEALGKRVGYFCSNPDCGRATVGPHTDPADWVNVGVAAHIVAASPGGPRANATLTSDQRKAATNGIWLCQTCSKMIDDDPDRYPVELLKKWKAAKEADADEVMGKGVLPSAGGPLLAVSPLLKVGHIGAARLADGSTQLMADIDSGDDDPTFYVTAFVFRLLVRPAHAGEQTILHGIGIDVLDMAPIPEHRVMAAALPAKRSLYLLPFDDPKVAGKSRFMAEKFYRVHAGTRSEECPYQPMILEEGVTEIIDCRLILLRYAILLLRRWPAR